MTLNLGFTNVIQKYSEIDLPPLFVFMRVLLYSSYRPIVLFVFCFPSSLLFVFCFPSSLLFVFCFPSSLLFCQDIISHLTYILFCTSFGLDTIRLLL